MLRRICSYDIVEVPANAYVLTDSGGDFYLCNERCLCLWAIQHATATRPNNLEGESFVMTSPAGERRKFANLRELAMWSSANALSPGKGAWIKLGKPVE